MTPLSERMRTADLAASSLLSDVERLTVAWHPGSARLTRTLATLAPSQPFCYHALAAMGYHPTSVTSRLVRAGLPTPKEQLACFRLSLALRLSRHWDTVKEVAYHLQFSSPQSFGRHVRERTQLSPAVFFATWTPESYWQALAGFMRWDDERWITLDALKGAPLPLGVKAVRIVAERPALRLDYCQGGAR